MSAPHMTSDGTVSLSDEEGVKHVLVDTVYALWDAVNNLTRLKPAHRPYYRVSIFGSARAQPGTPVYNEVKKLAAAITSLGCDIITGGGPGLMQAANEGAMQGNPSGKQKSMGIRIALPFEQNVNKYVEKSYEHRTFFTRLHHFVLASDAFVVVPGGIGTVLEMLMVWQLLQVKHLPPMPFVLIGEMYQELVEWARIHMTTKAQVLANPEDMQLPQCVRTVDEAVAIIKEHRSLWERTQRSSLKS